MEMQSQKFRQKIRKSEVMSRGIEKMLKSLEEKFPRKENLSNKEKELKSLHLPCYFSEANNLNSPDEFVSISTMESSTKEKFSNIQAPVKKNRNFKAISNKMENNKYNSNCSSNLNFLKKEQFANENKTSDKVEKQFKKNKNIIGQNFNKIALEKETKISELTEKIKEKFYDDLQTKKTNMITLASHKVKDSKNQLRNKKINGEKTKGKFNKINFLLNFIFRRHIPICNFIC
jgi:Ni,Fe-hydrogenase I large subunit